MNKLSNKWIDLKEIFNEKQLDKNLEFNLKKKQSYKNNNSLLTIIENKKNKFFYKKDKKNKKIKKGIGLYKTFEIYNEELNFLINNYNKLKDSYKKWKMFAEKINKIYIFYNYKNLSGSVKYYIRGKLRVDDFIFYFKKFKKDKSLYNIFKMNNLILKEAFSKLNRHGLAFKYIYDMIYRKILKYPYLITIKPKTIIILDYNKFIKYIFEWQYSKNLENKNIYTNKIKRWIRISISKKFTIFDKLNFYNYYIYSNYIIIKKLKNNINFFFIKNYRTFLIIKNLYMEWEFNYLINVKKKQINMDEFWNKITYNYIEEECENLYIDYIKEIKENNKFSFIKENLFKLILKKNSINIWYINFFYKKNLYIEEEFNEKKKIYNELNFFDLIKYFIKSKKHNKLINHQKDSKNKFFNKEKFISSFKKNIHIEYNYVYKLYFLYFFWSLFYLNKIFFYLNKIFFNLWNRYYYFYENSYNIKNNKLFFSYLILYEKNNLYNNIEFENKWKYFINFFIKNIKYYKKNIDINYEIWKKYYNHIFIMNNEYIKNKIYNIYNKYLFNLNIYKIYNKKIFIYEKINKLFNILDNLWKNNYNYNIYYNYNYLSVWKINSQKNYELTNKPNITNNVLLEYKKINNYLEYIFYNDKLLYNDNLIDSKIKNNIYYENKLNRNKKKIWYK